MTSLPDKKRIKKVSGLDKTKEAEDKISSYMKAQNRPYSVQNVFDNLHGVFSKALVSQAMENLCGIGDCFLVMKEYGSQKVFCFNQLLFGDCCMDVVTKLESELQSLKNELLQIDGEKMKIEKSIPIPDDVLLEEFNKVSNSVIDLRDQLANLKSEFEKENMKVSLDSLGNDIHKESLNSVNDIVAECQKRKRICMAMVDSLASSMNVSRIEVADSLGLDLIVFTDKKT